MIIVGQPNPSIKVVHICIYLQTRALRDSRCVSVKWYIQVTIELNIPIYSLWINTVNIGPHRAKRGQMVKRNLDTINYIYIHSSGFANEVNIGNRLPLKIFWFWMNLIIWFAKIGWVINSKPFFFIISGSVNYC